jgi:nucleoside-diphosphate-sugar epimerase
METEIEGRKAAVTGAGGFIGAAVCRRLAEAGAEVIGVELDAAAAARAEEAGAEPRLADVTDPEATREALRDAELVVHTAAHVREWGSMRDFIRVNVGGTVSVLDAAEAAGAERVVHVSSVVVYGYTDERRQDESAHRRAVGIPYIDTKSASDWLAARRGAVVLRPGDVYGPGSIPWVVRPLEVMRSGAFAVPEGGSGNMLPVFIDDLAESIHLALRRGEPGSTYTAWSGERITFGDYFDRLAAAAGVPPPRRAPRTLIWLLGAAAETGARALGRPPPFGRHGAHLLYRRGSVSNESAREGLGWEPRIGLAEGIQLSVQATRGESQIGSS